MSDAPRPRYDLAAVKTCFTMAELIDREKPSGHVWRRQGGRLVMPCPFHAEKSASFGTDNQRPHSAHCFGCGWHGSIIDFWIEWRGVDLATAIQQLAELAGLTPRTSESVTWGSGTRKVPLVTQVAKPELEKPPLPRLTQLKPLHMEQIAETRGVSVEAVRIAALNYRRAGFCLWPQHLGRNGEWYLADEHFPSWCMTDDLRNCAEFRRLDNRPYPTHSKNDDGKWVLNEERLWIKAWSTRGKNWPLGAAELGKRKAVVWVKGGPDMLAAYHFLFMFRQLNRVAVCAMLGESARIREDALPYFQGARVRIFFDADKTQVKVRKLRDGTESVKRSQPGIDACARWTEQLTGAGAAVKSFDFRDPENRTPPREPDTDVPMHINYLRRVDGEPVKDLNDLARCNSETVDHPEIRDAFFDWDF